MSTRSTVEKLLKHVKFMSLSHIKKVVDITNSESKNDFHVLVAELATNLLYSMITLTIFSCYSFLEGITKVDLYIFNKS